MADSKLRVLFDQVVDRNPGEAEFHQAVREVFDSLAPDVAKHPEYTDAAVAGGVASDTSRSSGWMA